MKGLLIDDLALQGWKYVLEKAVIKNTLSLHEVTDYDSALKKLDEKYDILFLDIRLNESDHLQTDISELSGYKILKRIKGDFLSPNFCTPIILFTASNKIWYIDAFKEYGVDCYYIKEHPDFVYTASFSQENLQNLRKGYNELLKISEKRSNVWNICKSIIEIVSTHSYFSNASDALSQNIKQRIIDKIKLGYGYLFSKTNKFEIEILNRNNESLSFIIFWSVLEEISKGYTDYKATWGSNFIFKGEWKYRNKDYFIKKNGFNKIEVLSNKLFMKKNVSRARHYISGHINLSEQIYVLLNSYSIDEQSFRLLSIDFKSINDYRNKTDYIHSSVDSILKSKLINQMELDDAYNMNLNVLKFIEKILQLPTSRPN